MAVRKSATYNTWVVRQEDGHELKASFRLRNEYHACQSKTLSSKAKHIGERRENKAGGRKRGGMREMAERFNKGGLGQEQKVQQRVSSRKPSRQSGQSYSEASPQAPPEPECSPLCLAGLRRVCSVFDFFSFFCLFVYKKIFF